MCDYCYDVAAEEAARLNPEGLEHSKYVEAQHIKMFRVSVMDRPFSITDGEKIAKVRRDKNMEEYLLRPLP